VSVLKVEGVGMAVFWTIRFRRWVYQSGSSSFINASIPEQKPLSARFADHNGGEAEG